MRTATYWFRRLKSYIPNKGSGTLLWQKFKVYAKKKKRAGDLIG